MTLPRLGVLLLSLLAVAALAAPSAHAAFPGANGRLAFHATNCCDLSMQVYTVAPRGGEPTEIWDAGESPELSADGRRIVLAEAMLGDEEQSIYIAADGEYEILGRLTSPGSGEGDLDPTWAPDGRRIAFTRCTDCDTRARRDFIYTVRRDRRGLKRLRAGANPAWSVQDRIAYRGEDGIYTMSSDGRHARRVTSRRGDSEPDWSPDGRQIVFTRRSRMYAVSATGGPVRDLGAGYGPSFSPDGRQLAFVRSGRLHVANRDGSRPRRLRVRDCTPADVCYPQSTDWGPRPR